jgi:protein-disulfide isomerase
MLKHTLAAAGAAIMLAGCSSTSAQQTRAPASTDIVATVGSESITLARVDEKAMQTPVGNFGNVKLSQALYEARRAVLDDLIDGILIQEDAKAQKTTADALIAREVTAKVPAPNDAEIAAWYEANKTRLQGAPFDQVRSGIRNLLIQQQTGAVRDAYISRLKTKTAVRVMLEPPRQVIATAGHPSRGPKDAPVEIVEFSDFQCPYCFHAHPTVNQVLAAYGDRLHFVYRHYPLSIHPNARAAAEAAACADEQGKFWPFHDDLFSDQSRMSDSDLKDRAAHVGVDAKRFNQCFESHKYKDQVEQDFKDGDEAGVNGTPSFFINGRLLTGAQPFDAFKRIIDEELAMKKR